MLYMLYYYYLILRSQFHVLKTAMLGSSLLPVDCMTIDVVCLMFFICLLMMLYNAFWLYGFTSAFLLGPCISLVFCISCALFVFILCVVCRMLPVSLRSLSLVTISQKNLAILFLSFMFLSRNHIWVIHLSVLSNKIIPEWRIMT